ncbi:uncharacterized protein LOC109820921 [Asparagus officinalis]|uniref:uncharacterized protein LOC109820921 n=1 Tax=Asparagus officinalis TaxID=4686 RepID=UPI00098E4316|nr:uncharacterized protein LOC109820921 [Asparagus officinalis]
MSAISERDQEEQEAQNSDEEFDSGNNCLSFLCFPFGLKIDTTSYRSLLLGDSSSREKWWEKRSRSAKEFVLQSIGSIKLKTFVQKLRFKYNDTIVKRRKPIFRYDSKSYKLNFDGNGVEDGEILYFSERTAA